jgi:hypothetical protein
MNDSMTLLLFICPAVMSSDDAKDVVMKGIMRGACDYFLKPVCLQRLRTIWQHVIRRREMIEAAKDGDSDDAARGSKLLVDKDGSRKRKGKEEAADDGVEFVNGNKKKTRLVWTSTLHKQFVDAVKILGTASEYRNSPWLMFKPFLLAYRRIWDFSVTHTVLWI